MSFKEFIFFRKRPWKCATPFAQPNCENKSFEPDHQIPSHCPIRRFLTMITNFFGSLKSKRRWLFRNNKLSLKIFWFQALRKPRFENKGNFWINYVCIKAFASLHAHKRAFASLHTYKRTLGHSHHDISTRRHLHHCTPTNGAFTSLHTHKRTFTSWHAP